MELMGVVTICAGVAAWGAVEFYRREQAHRQEMAWLRQGILPPAPPDHPPPAQIVTMAFLALVLGGVVVWLVVLARSFRLSNPILWAAGFLGLVFALLLIILVRDVRMYSRRRRQD